MSDSLTTHLIELISPLVTPLGYEIVHLEVIQRQKTLRLYIDHLDSTAGIGIQDCVKVTKALDEPLDQMPDVDKAFGGGTYELEVSSPGIDRPLRSLRDFDKFKGREIRVHTFRPLTGEELGNADYQSKNPKQKNFLGTLQGVRGDKVVMTLNLTGGFDPSHPDFKKKSGKKGKASPADRKEASPTTNSVEGEGHAMEVTFPLPLISKANLEPLDLLEQLEGSASQI
jgi:ribosome maturation factor RimP